MESASQRAHPVRGSLFCLPNQKSTLIRQSVLFFYLIGYKSCAISWKEKIKTLLLWSACVCPLQNSETEALTPPWMVFAVGAFGRWLGSDEVMGMGQPSRDYRPYEKTTRQQHTKERSCEQVTWRRQTSAGWEEGLIKDRICSTLTLDFMASELWEISILCLRLPVCIILLQQPKLRKTGWLDSDHSFCGCGSWVKKSHLLISKPYKQRGRGSGILCSVDTVIPGYIAQSLALWPLKNILLAVYYS